MAFIDIETKEDTAAKLAVVSGKPTKNYLFAAELNKIKSRIETLWNAISGSATITEQNKVILGTISEPFIDVLNQAAVIAWKSPVFVTYDIAGTYYTQAFVGQSGDYGDGSGQFVPEDFVLVEQSNDAPTPPTNSYVLRATIGDYDGAYMGVIENTFPGDVAFLKYDDGYYAMTFSTNYTPDISKFQVFFGASNNEIDSLGKFSASASDGHTVTIQSKVLTTGVPEAGYMKGVPIMIYYK